MSEPSPLEIAKNMIHEGLVECSELKQRIAELEAQQAKIRAEVTPLLIDLERGGLATQILAILGGKEGT